IGEFLNNPDLGGQERVRIFCQIVDCYLGSQTTQLKHLICSLENNKPDVSTPKEDTDLSPPAWTCLLCETSFVQRAGLTRHNQFQHYNRGTFDQPLPCPRCGPKYTLNGAEELCNHTERYHGAEFPPNLPRKELRVHVQPKSPKRPKTRSASCPICEHMFYPGNSMSRHMNQKHDTQFNRPFNCPECERQGLAKTIIIDRETWMRHMEERHGCDGQTGAAV
ncbi:hypothetical protein QBC38DRAFT_328036, partial [Podospora fimiseda]